MTKSGHSRKVETFTVNLAVKPIFNLFQRAQIEDAVKLETGFTLHRSTYFDIKRNANKILALDTTEVKRNANLEEKTK